MDGGAEFSDCRLYRYRLWREVNPLLGKGTIAFLMLNPSTADAVENDPTIRRCIGFARTWGFRRLEILNLFAFRSPFPATMKKAHDQKIDVIGPGNDEAIRDIVRKVPIVVAAWGALDDWAVPRGRKVAEMIPRMGVLGLTKAGHPRHPLYIRAGVEPIPWKGYE